MIIITIPAYNEEKTIGRVVQDIKKVMGNGKYKDGFRILVVDDGSRDNTASEAKKAGAVVFSHAKNYGLAEAFRTEIEKCREMHADTIVHIDADTQYTAQEIPKLLKEIENGYDLVLGSRFLGTIEEMPLIKRWGNMAFSRVISGVTGIEITDAQTGFRAFTKKVAEEIEITSLHTYTQEHIIRAVRHKFKIKEVPIYFAKRHDESRLISSPFGYAVRAWINLVRIYRDYEPLKFFGNLGATIFFIGFLLGLYLVYFQFFGNGAFRHLGLMMLDILILSIALQVTIFAFIADMNRK
jgi:glycosyltransferase involved in cell wall biosynthesis